MSFININNWIRAGFEMAQWGLLDENGLFIGQELVLANGATSPMGRLFNVQTADVELPEPVRVPVLGDDFIAGTFMFQSADPVTFDIIGGQAMLKLAALSDSSLVYALGDWNMLPLGRSLPSFRDFCLLLTSQAKSQEVGSKGVSGYDNLLIPSCQISFSPQSREHQTAGSFRYSITVNLADKFPWGTPFNQQNIGATEAHMILFGTRDRITMQAYRDNGSTGAFTLARTPAGNETTNKTKLWRDGVGFTPTAINTTTRVVTFTPGAAGDLVVAAEEYSGV